MATSSNCFVGEYINFFFRNDGNTIKWKSFFDDFKFIIFFFENEFFIYYSIVGGSSSNRESQKNDEKNFFRSGINVYINRYTIDTIYMFR